MSASVLKDQRCLATLLGGVGSLQVFLWNALLTGQKDRTTVAMGTNASTPNTQLWIATPKTSNATPRILRTIRSVPQTFFIVIYVFYWFNNPPLVLIHLAIPTFHKAFEHYDF